MALQIVMVDGENHGKADQKSQGLSDRDRDQEIRQTDSEGDRPESGLVKGLGRGNLQSLGTRFIREIILAS